MGIFLALLPAIAWGSILLFSVKLGGGAYSQTVGMTFGALFFSIVVYVFIQPVLTLTVLVVGFVSGLFWAFGQVNQLKTVEKLGVSSTVPISTGLQFVSTSFFGVIVFREWSTIISVVLGVFALVFIVVGVVFTSFESDEEKNAEPAGHFKRGLLILFVSTFGYFVYVVVIRLFNVDGWSAFLPQAVGMFFGGVLLTFKHHPFNKYAIRNVFSGLLWGAGNLFLFLSLPRVGVATSFSLSQIGIVISTFGGIVFLGERKTKRQLMFIVVGIVFIIGGAVLLGMTKA
ncbi:glucose transporter GlcU [Bacillus anthracis]|nr:glucose transporter GlcU [Bacillus anthracis]